jgi:HEPN domain-containing protein
MDDPGRAVVRQWLDKAERDLASALRLLEGDPPFPDTAVYHCQQAAEKALKAFLAAQNRPIRRVHDLVLLVDECAGIEGVFAGLGEAAAVLTPYGTAFRYPGDLSEPDPTDAREAIDCARHILDLVTEVLAGPAGDLGKP